MAASVLYYLVVTLAAAALYVWTLASAIPAVKEHDRAHRLWTLVGSALLLCAFASATVAVPLGYPELSYGAILLPVAVVCTTWSSVMTLRDQRLILKVLHLPTLLFNATLVGLYAVRVVQDFLGEDLGTWGGALTLAHVTVQTQVGGPAAADMPIWFHLPFLLPVCLRFRWHHVVALSAAGALSSAMLAMLIAAMPMAYTRINSYRRPPPQDIRLAKLGPVSTSRPTAPGLRGPRPVGVKAPWGLWVLPSSTLQQVREALLELRASNVAVDVCGDTFTDARLHDQVTRELAWAAEHGLSVTVFCKPSPRVDLLRSASLEDFRQKLAVTQWLAAEQLKPTLLVLFSGPFAHLAAATHDPPSIDEWMAAITLSAREARQANPEVKVGVAFECLGPHAAELFRRLRAEASPVDVVGLNIFPRQRLIADLDKELSRLRRFVEDNPGSRRVEIFETGCTPHAAGGELGQWHFLVRVLATANLVEDIEAVSIDALSDPRTTRGLLTWTGRRRLAFRLLCACATAARPPR